MLFEVVALGLIVSGAIAARTKCPPGYTNCADPGQPLSCVNLQANADFCGSCDPGSYCPYPQYCLNGVCREPTDTCNPNAYSVVENPVFCGVSTGDCKCVRGVGHSVTQCLLPYGGCPESLCVSDADCTRSPGGVCATNVCQGKGKNKGKGACFYSSRDCK